MTQWTTSNVFPCEDMGIFPSELTNGHSIAGKRDEGAPAERAHTIREEIQERCQGDMELGLDRAAPSLVS